jgi:hypothetical protein
MLDVSVMATAKACEKATERAKACEKATERAKVWEKATERAKVWEKARQLLRYQGPRNRCRHRCQGPMHWC